MMAEQKHGGRKGRELTVEPEDMVAGRAESQKHKVEKGSTAGMV